MNALKIYGKSWADEWTTFLASSGANTHLLVDQDSDTVWESDGSADGVDEFVELTFNNHFGTEAMREIDRIIILNTNAKDILIERWDGSAWVSVYTEDDISRADLHIDLASSIETEQLKITIEGTQTPDEDKHIGEIKACLSVFTGSQLWRSGLSVSPTQRAGDDYTVGGRLRFWREWQRWGAKLSLEFVSQADFELLRGLTKTSAPVVIVPNYVGDPGEVYECAIVSPLDWSREVKTGLYSVDLELKQI